MIDVTHYCHYRRSFNSGRWLSWWTTSHKQQRTTVKRQWEHQPAAIRTDWQKTTSFDSWESIAIITYKYRTVMKISWFASQNPIHFCANQLYNSVHLVVNHLVLWWWESGLNSNCLYNNEHKPLVRNCNFETCSYISPNWNKISSIEKQCCKLQSTNTPVQLTAVLQHTCITWGLKMQHFHNSNAICLVFHKQ